MTICIVEDHLIISQSLKGQLSAAPYFYEVFIYNTAEAFLKEEFKDGPPDIVIVDIMLPLQNGVEAIVQAKHSLANTKFIILSSIIEGETVKNALRKGANGYLSKDISFEELIEAMQAVLAGRRYINTTLKNKILEHLFEPDPFAVHLSPRERLVLQKICEGCTPKEIAYQNNISLNTVQQYVQSLLKKFDVNRTTDLAILAVQKGLYKPHI